MLLRRIYRRLSNNDPYSKIKPEVVGREFYLDPKKQYVYTPKEQIIFDNEKAVVYENYSHTLKVFYLPKLFFSVLIVTAFITMNSYLSYALIGGIIYGITGTVAGSHAIFGARVLNKIVLHLDGKHVDLTYKVFPFIPRTKTYKITQFRQEKVPLLIHI